MTNFLNRMAGRAMGAITTAQPFVPSVFTPAFGLARNNASAFSFLDPTTEDIQRGADHVRQSDASEGTRDARLPGRALNPTVMSSDAVSPQTESLPAPEFAAEHLDRPLLFPTTTFPAKPDSATATLRARVHLQPEGISSHTSDQSIATSLGPDQTHLPESGQLIIGVAQRQRVAPTLTGARNQANASPIYSPRDAHPVPEAPVIRVSIGRIDVRAEFAAAPPSPAPARNIRPAALSLDEYLKQRSEGRR